MLMLVIRGKVLKIFNSIHDVKTMYSPMMHVYNKISKLSEKKIDDLHIL